MHLASFASSVFQIDTRDTFVIERMQDFMLT